MKCNRKLDDDSGSFLPWDSLFEGVARPGCRASVIVPARNEEASIEATLIALFAQVDGVGEALDHSFYEVLLLLNNCTDETVSVARKWAEEHRDFDLKIAEKELADGEAHVGTARRLLMDSAWHRLSGSGPEVRGILSTDSDTIVAPDWVWRNLSALEGGADAVGGEIRLKPGDLEALPEGAKRAYLRDRRYQSLVAEVEYLLNPTAGDPWPRHLEHFGASLACTPQAYSRAGGLPPVNPLEDVAFVNRLKQSRACLRHDPAVVVYTSARLDGRAEVGLSHQLRTWQWMCEVGQQHLVPSSRWMTHRLRLLRQFGNPLLEMQARKPEAYPSRWRKQIVESRGHQVALLSILGEEKCEELIGEMFHGNRYERVEKANANLASCLRRLRGVSPETLEQDGSITEAEDDATERKRGWRGLQMRRSSPARRDDIPHDAHS